jgi:isoquinoline 1-oxidoreductase beta subunit
VSSVANLSRREVLKLGALAGGGLVLGFVFPRAERAHAEDKVTAFAPNAFVRIGTDESLTVIVNHSEMGQGAYTSIAMTLAEELDADWTKIRFEPAPVDPAYNHPAFGMQATGGSTSTWVEWDRLRHAGAAARWMLVKAAADEWKVDAAEVKTEPGVVVHGQKRATYGQLAEKASKLAPPEKVTLKDPKSFRIIGKPTKRLDTPEKTNGKAIFGIDVSLPNMRVALIARPPVFGATLKTVAGDDAKAVPGVERVVQIPRGVAVVANGFHAAMLGRDALKLDWEPGPLATLDSDAQGSEYAALAKKPGAVARNDGDARGSFQKSEKKIDAVYDLPYLAHACMEPLNGVADVRPDGCDVWVGTQFQTVDRNAAAAVAGLPPEKVRVHTTYLGGGFGRRAMFDAHVVVEAVQISKAIGAPVKVIWTREDDTRGGLYRPRSHHAVRAALGNDGAPLAWEHHVVCQSFAVGSPIEKMLVKDGVDVTSVEGAKELPYAIPHVRVEWHQAPNGVPVHFWRSVGHSHNAFVVESVIDELAHAAGKDPFELRRALLEKSPRHKRALELAAEKAGWGTPLAAGRGRGIAVHEAFGSIVAHVAEVSVAPNGKPRVHRFTTAIDAGPIVNPDTVAAQMQSAIVFGLTAALYGEITFEKGRVKQSNFHDYPMLRMNEMPEVAVHIVASEERMGGVGEPGVPPVAPALTNAIFAATGKRVRRLPIRVADLKR